MSSHKKQGRRHLGRARVFVSLGDSLPFLPRWHEFSHQFSFPRSFSCLFGLISVSVPPCEARFPLDCPSPLDT